jgi:lipoprotein-anchoring transpeptidase ErfK/SrfK
MNDDELERLLADSFDREARASIGDRGTPPAPRFLDQQPVGPRRRLAARVAAPLAAAAAVIAVVSGVLVLQHSSGSGTPAAQSRPVSHPSPPRTTLSSVSGARKPVHIKLLNSDGSTVGIGMPVIAYFSRPITDGRAFAAATTLTVDGKPANGAWYFERSAADPNYPIEAHFRMASYWPANAKIHVGLPVADVSAGDGMAFDDSLTLDFSTGPAQIVTVDDVAHRLVLTRDGRQIEQAPVSLGSSKTPTLRGTKVIMDKQPVISMRSPGFYRARVQWTERLTYSGEYLHAAPWNEKNIDLGVDTSNGCTNLLPTDAKTLFSDLRIGDVVQFPNATGSEMTLGDGYGDWNMTWGQWQSGGLVPTH